MSEKVKPNLNIVKPESLDDLNLLIPGDVVMLYHEWEDFLPSAAIDSPFSPRRPFIYFDTDENTGAMTFLAPHFGCGALYVRSRTVSKRDIRLSDGTIMLT